MQPDIVPRYVLRVYFQINGIVGTHAKTMDMLRRDVLEVIPDKYKEDGLVKYKIMAALNLMMIEASSDKLIPAAIEPDAEELERRREFIEEMRAMLPVAKKKAKDNKSYFDI